MFSKGFCWFLHEAQWALLEQGGCSVKFYSSPRALYVTVLPPVVLLAAGIAVLLVFVFLGEGGLYEFRGFVE